MTESLSSILSTAQRRSSNDAEQLSSILVDMSSSLYHRDHNSPFPVESSSSFSSKQILSPSAEPQPLMGSGLLRSSGQQKALHRVTLCAQFHWGKSWAFYINITTSLVAFYIHIRRTYDILNNNLLECNGRHGRRRRRRTWEPQCVFATCLVDLQTFLLLLVRGRFVNSGLVPGLTRYETKPNHTQTGPAELEADWFANLLLNVIVDQV